MGNDDPEPFAENRQNDEGYLQLWQAPQQDARSVQTLRLSLPARPEEDLRQLRIPKRQRCRFNWGAKANRRKTTGSGRMRTLKGVPRKFKNGFQVGTPKGAKGPANQA